MFTPFFNGVMAYQGSSIIKYGMYQSRKILTKLSLG